MATPQLPAVNTVANDVLVIGGVEIPVSGTDVNWSCVRADRGVMSITNGGQAIWSQSPDNSGVITINCSILSLANKRLGALIAGVGGAQAAPLAVRAVHSGSGTSVSDGFGWVQTPGPITSQRADAPVTWTVAIGGGVWTYSAAVPG